LSLWVLCVCQVEVSATNWSLVQRSPTDCGASLCVISRPRRLKTRKWVVKASGIIIIIIIIIIISKCMCGSLRYAESQRMRTANILLSLFSNHDCFKHWIKIRLNHEATYNSIKILMTVHGIWSRDFFWGGKSPKSLLRAWNA
jgi:hypothetical protein